MARDLWSPWRMAILSCVSACLVGAAAAQDTPRRPAKPRQERPELKKQDKADPEKARRGPPAVRGDDDDKGGPPAGVPPAAARGLKLAQFIAAAKAKGLDGEALAAAIHAERARLGLGDEDDDD